MRYFAIGDIHGCFSALTTLVDYVGIHADDTVITMGDYVDRGPDTRAVLDWLIEFSKTHRLIPLRGNHEIMMLRASEDPQALQNWLSVGGNAALKSYAAPGQSGSLHDVPKRHWDFLERELLPWFESETHFFVHANAWPDIPLGEQPDLMLYWEPFDFPAKHESGKIMVCGHTSQKNGLPNNVGHAVCIDTWACGQGWLTCLDPATGRYWQANQQGETRQSFLDEL
jgi:serine/threonine protein phosphatase 1